MKMKKKKNKIKITFSKLEFNSLCNIMEVAREHSTIRKMNWIDQLMADTLLTKDYKLD
jgi:hypothetical protein